MPPSSSRTACATRRATWPSSARTSLDIPIVLGSATPSLETWPTRQGRPLPPARTCPSGPLPKRRCLRSHRSIPARRSCRTAVSEPLIAAIGGAPGARRAKPGLPQPPRLCAGAGLPGLRLDLALPALRRQSGPASGRPPPALPPLRLRERACRKPARLAATRTSSPSAAARSASKSGCSERFPQARILRVDRDSAKRRSSGRRCSTHPCRRGRHPGRHADAGQGPRFPEADAGRRARRRCRAVRRRLPRAGAPVRAADAGRRARPGAPSCRAKC